MRRYIPFIVTAISLLAFGLSACARETPPEASAPTPSREAPTAESAAPPEDSSSQQEDAPPVGELVPAPADAALYRGVVTIIQERDSDVILTLEQAPGTNFGSPSISVVVNVDTRANIDVSGIETDSYVEAYYGSRGDIPEEVTAITLNLLPDASLCLFNGELVELVSGNEGEGSMLLTSLEGTGDILFRWNSETQFYLNFDDLKEGDALNVYFNGATTRSMPPQATALEVRPAA